MWNSSKAQPNNLASEKFSEIAIIINVTIEEIQAELNDQVDK